MGRVILIVVLLGALAAPQAGLAASCSGEPGPARCCCAPPDAPGAAFAPEHGCGCVSRQQDAPAPATPPATQDTSTTAGPLAAAAPAPAGAAPPRARAAATRPAASPRAAQTPLWVLCSAILR